ncbi:MAG: leucyl aminopeptidase [Spirochaetia bacterium]|nr:leucyl aminopeptidase [Spirochaetia bacterium]
MRLTTGKAADKKDLLVVFTHETEKGKIIIHSDSQIWEPILSPLVKSGEFSGKENTSVPFYGVNGFQKIIFAGLPKNQPPYDGEMVRRLAAKLVPQFEKSKVVNLDLLLLSDIAEAAGTDPEIFLKSFVEGLLLKSYRFNKYKKPEKEKSKLEEVRILTNYSKADALVRDTAVICEGTAFARDLINEPSNVLNAVTLSEKAREAGRRHHFKVTVFDKKKIESLKMGGLLAVNAGSANPPRLITLEHRPKGAKKTILLVGKGVTFDTGGISIKPAAGMGEMKSDMSGAAAVLATVTTASRLRIPVNVIGVIPTTDNKTGSAAQNPGDVIRMMNGLTVEVDNTDAEGRLILGDALHYGISKFKPDVTIDLATLTGACVIALGQWAAGLMTNDKKLAGPLVAAGEKSFERVWPMPLFDEYAEQIKSVIADLKNVGGRPAGSLTAGKFLERFVDGKPWIHLDIAGTAFLELPVHYLPREGVGFGVRLLTEYLQAL